MPRRSLIPWRREDESPLMAMQRELNRMFEDFTGIPEAMMPSGMMERMGEVVEFRPRVDVVDADGTVKITAELPGVDPKDVEVSFTGNMLSIRGEKRDERKEVKGDYYRMERSYGAFQRTIPVNVDVDEKKIDAKYDNGVLTITMPKSEKAKQQMRKIEVKSAH